ncbi:MAG: hypothetical protein HY080_14435 [Gammaproteobacteria bacterium]|nr:hypothetical protein [Gammaproteobacteria bacterium]
MIGRTIIEFVAIAATAMGLVLMIALPSALTAAAGTALILVSIIALVRHYWVKSDPDTASFGGTTEQQ